MGKRSLEIVKATYPVTGKCDRCNAHFVSRNENLEIATKHVHDQFESHKCEVQSGYNDPIKKKQGE